MTIAAGGFGLCGIPKTSSRRWSKSGVRADHRGQQTLGVDDFGMGLLLKSRQVKKVIASLRRGNKEFERQVLAGELELQLTRRHARREAAAAARVSGLYTAPDSARSSRKQGHAVFRRQGIRAGGSDPRRPVDRQGMERRCVGQPGLIARRAQFQSDDRPLRQGHDRRGRAAVEVGGLDPDRSTSPGVYVDRIVQGRATRSASNSAPWPEPPPRRKSRRYARSWRSAAARELRDGYYVNLGMASHLVANSYRKHQRHPAVGKTGCSASTLPGGRPGGSRLINRASRPSPRFLGRASSPAPIPSP